MTPASTGPHKHTWTFAMLAALAFALVWLLYRNYGLNPTIFADEWYYSKMSRLSELKEAIVPSYLYLWMFKASNACGAGYLECARIGNVLLFVGAAPFVYLVARQFAGKAPSFLVALFAMLAPLNVFTAYFMPEATYYFGFCVLSWVALTRTNWGWGPYALATGAILGLMSLIKVHALFLVPALCLFLLYARWQRGGRWLAAGLLSMVLAGLTVLGVKFGLGYLLAGDAGLSLLGPFYQGGANAAGGRSPLTLLPPAFINGRGHLMALAILLGLPLAMLAYGLFARVFRHRSDRLNLLHVYALLMLGAAVGMTVMFTATLAQPGSPEGLRLHLRYYSFAFPLLWVVAAAAIGKAADQARPALRWIVALLLLAVLGIAIVKLPGYSLNAVDGPEIYAVKVRDIPGKILVALEMLALLMWALGRRNAAAMFMYVTLPLLLVAGISTTTRWLRIQVPQNTADKAGEFARRYVPPAEHGQIIIAGSDLGQIMRAQFHIDNKDTVPLEVPEGAPIAPYQLPVRNKWLLVLGKHPLPDGIKPVAATADYTLVQFKNTNRRVGVTKFSEPLGAGLITRAEGLSVVEPWGRWSDAKQVVLHFSQPLPRRLNLILAARAYDDNANLPFTIHVGGKSETFRLGWTTQEIGLHFETDGTVRSLAIDVPHPVSPAEAGHPGDPRKLGIGIVELEVGDAGQASN
jgi:phosphoglycerol transferase